MVREVRGLVAHLRADLVRADLVRAGLVLEDPVFLVARVAPAPAPAPEVLAPVFRAAPARVLPCRRRRCRRASRLPLMPRMRPWPAFSGH